MTVLSLITSAMRLIGVTASGEAISADEAANGLSVLNDMLETWTTQSLLIYNKIPETFALVPNQQSYTWGVGGDFNSARPQDIENINWLQVSSSTTVELPIEIINQDQWAAITVKTITSNLPTRMWPVFTVPTATLYFWPIPSVSGNVKIWSWKALTAFSALTDTITLPPGYTRALRYNLAVEFAPEYGKQLDPVIAEIAGESKAAIKRMNHTPQYLGMDAGVLQRKSTWNWYTGE